MVRTVTRRQRLLLLGRLALAALILILLYGSGRLDLRRVFDVRIAAILISLPLYVISFLMGAYRWWYLVRAVGFPVPFWDIVRLTMTGVWLSSVLPGGSIAAGDAARATMLTLENRDRASIALASVFMDRLLGLFAIVGIAGVSLLMNHHAVTQIAWLRWVSTVLVGSVLVAGAGVAVVTSEKISHVFESLAVLRKMPLRGSFLRLLDGFRVFRDRPKALLMGFFVSCIGQASMVLAIYLLAVQSGVLLADTSAYVSAISIGIIAAMIPISGPAGIGTGNAGFAVTFALAGSSRGAELAALWQVTFVLASQVGLPFFLSSRREKSSQPAALPVSSGHPIILKGAGRP